MKATELLEIYRVVSGLKADADREKWDRKTWMVRVRLEMKTSDEVRPDVPDKILCKAMKQSGAGFVKVANPRTVRAKSNPKDNSYRTRFIARQLFQGLKELEFVCTSLGVRFNQDGKLDLDGLLKVARGQKVETPTGDDKKISAGG